MRTGLPIMQPSPRKSPGPRIASTASLPCGFTMVSLALPDWMYQTSLQGSSCEKSACPFLYLMTRRDIPALERYSSTLKPGRFFVFFAVLATATGSLTPIMSRLVSKVNDPRVGNDSRVLTTWLRLNSTTSLHLATRQRKTVRAMTFGSNSRMELTTIALRGTLPTCTSGPQFRVVVSLVLGP